MNKESTQSLEAKRIKNGWRYVRISPNYQVLVPFDQTGAVTADGRKRIERHKKLLGIKN